MENCGESCEVDAALVIYLTCSVDVHICSGHCTAFEKKLGRLETSYGHYLSFWILFKIQKTQRSGDSGQHPDQFLGVLHMISTTDTEQFQKAKAASAQEEAGTPAAGSLSFGCSDPMAGANV